MFDAGGYAGPLHDRSPSSCWAMGEVYSGPARHMGRDAAIKVLRTELTEEADVVTRFFTECARPRPCANFGIVEIFDCDLHRSGRAFIVMEYLSARIWRGASRSSDRSRRTGRPFVRSAAARERSPRRTPSGSSTAISPGNIFLVGEDASRDGADREDRRLRHREAAAAGRRLALARRPGTSCTLLYMSPEQARGAKIDHRTDIHALGCEAFEMTTGQPPFVRKGLAEVIVAQLHRAALRARRRSSLGAGGARRSRRADDGQGSRAAPAR